MVSHFRWKIWLFFVAVTGLTGGASTLLAGDISAKYEALQKPPLAPPALLFGIVWIVLYMLIATAAYLIWTTEHSRANRRLATGFYIGQLVLNFFWGLFFFGLELYWIAAGVLLAVIVGALLVIFSFFRVSRVAGWLFVPYLLWLLFAAYFNIGCALLND